MKKIIIYIQSNDKPGIISTISKYINKNNGNIETSKMIRLESNFNMIMLVSINEINFAKLNSSLKILSKKNKKLFIKIDLPNKENKVTNHLYFFQLKGADTEGLVHIFTDYLSFKKINIENMETEIINAPITGHPLFLLKAIIKIPTKINIEVLKNELEKLAETNNVAIKLFSIS